MIGLIVALPREIPTGFVRATSGAASQALSFPLYECTTASLRLVAVQTGVGRTRAVAGARFLVRQCAPQALVSCGFAGGLHAGLAPGMLVIGDRLVSVDPADSCYEADRQLIEQMLRAARAEQLPARQGAVVSAERLMPDGHSKSALARQSGASMVDMETRGIVEVACQAGLAWVALRAIVDTVDEVLPIDCLTILGADGRVAAGRLARGVWRSPGMLRDFLWLARRTAIARRHLSRLLQRWATDATPYLSGPLPSQFPSPSMGEG